MRLIPILSLAAIAACAAPVQVRTAASPDASVSNLHTFIVMATPKRRQNGVGDEFNNVDPMLQNSITYRALHNDLVSNFQERGYVVTEGTVVVDVINPTTKELLWRGQGNASVSDDPQTYAKDLARTVEKIIERFPEAAPARPNA